ncbi:QsdR family transcriptional regulator [Microbacterium sp. zg.Y1090]|uniref:QsdR family transcriptional regulator n=1 Tax=Microbacterium TaxID=33882 RepID=UPI00214B654A|nr:MULTISPECIES: QsdR family transcriptional regulator [unclassified Microbacterium]MCR2813163.1 QsdR family transcriptional regulator [Microbacterium sp. zg.Y1084]MCR2819476.1 QsdR family transcriptional regulator [Microbacterium sp. zg.Y1090]MDL5487330.1 QsdR family transcriptional regulator [Microbacterium sp. zg-Y1211]WIM28449.1 QsdR family transcriptional regulator [Microbacterium sp. zg-Y1090]
MSTPMPVTAVIATVGVDAAPSWLSERLASHADARRAFDLAREQFIAGQRIDMGALAAALGVDRTSLFRWVGNRDALLSEVLWSLAVPTLVQADHATVDRAGADRLAELLTRFVADLNQAPYFREFLRREPARALRLLTTKESEIQRRYVATAEWLVRAELGDEPLGGAIDPRNLAYLLVRVSESFTYADLIAGDEPSAARARTAFRVLLRAD